MIWTKSFERVEAALNSALNQQTLQSGWRQPPSHLAQFGEDDATRAAVSEKISHLSSVAASSIEITEYNMA